VLKVEGRLVEESKRELLPQQSADGLIDPSLAHLAGSHQLNHQLGRTLTAELVHACVDRLLRSFQGAQMFNAPGAGQHRLAGEQ
jgi:hypothetical protein